MDADAVVLWHGGNAGEPNLLESCYRSSLELAAAKGFKQVAFPAISTGIFGYPLEQATRIALSTMRNYEDRFEKIIACCFSADDKQTYDKVLREL